MLKKYILFATTLVSIFVASRYLVPQPVEFDSLDDCKRCLESRGFHCAFPKEGSLIVSTEPMTDKQIIELSMCPVRNNTGKLVISQYFKGFSSSRMENSVHINGFFLVGDSKLLEEIEPLFR